MVPAAEPDRAQAADHVGQDVEGVERAAVGEEGLHDLGPQAQDERADQQGQLQGAAARGGVGDPVEDEREEEEGEEVEEFVVGLELRRDCGFGAVREEADVGGEDEKEEECAWGCLC